MPKANIDRLLVRLGKVAEYGNRESAKAKSLIDWYYRNGEWTKKQLGFVYILAKSPEPKKKTGPTEYFLYAITDGKYVKLGFSVDPRRRLRDMQTSAPSKLTLLWMYRAGFNRRSAENAERKLHRYCKEFKRRGEWFKSECMERVKKFTLDRDKQGYRAEEEYELDIVAEANEHI